MPSFDASDIPDIESARVGNLLLRHFALRSESFDRRQREQQKSASISRAGVTKEESARWLEEGKQVYVGLRRLAANWDPAWSDAHARQYFGGDRRTPAIDRK